ncbi:hypothetical protein WJ971_15980 [Achromobacter xylosoxidans]
MLKIGQQQVARVVQAFGIGARQAGRRRRGLCRLQGAQRQRGQFEGLGGQVHALERALHGTGQHLPAQGLQRRRQPQVGLGVGIIVARRAQQADDVGGLQRQGVAQVVQRGAQRDKAQRPARAELVLHAQRVAAQAQVQQRSADLRGRRARHAVAQFPFQHQHQLQAGCQVFEHPLAALEA